MDGASYKKFLIDIRVCSDNRLEEVYKAVIDEMEHRAWQRHQISQTVESISEVESDWAYGVNS